MRTSSLLAMVVLKPRALMAYEVALTRGTSRLGASRSASGRRVAPERRMSSRVITKIAAGASESRSACRDTEVIWMLPSSSMLRSPISATRMGCAPAAAETRKTLKTRARRQRDRGVGAPLDDQLQHVPLAQGEAVERADVRAFAKVVVDHRLGNPMAQVALARPQRADRLHHFLARGFLQDVALRARLQGAVDVLGAQIHGQDQHARFRTFLDDAPRLLHAVELRHGDVHDDDVGAQAQSLGDRIAAVARGRNPLQVARSGQGTKTVTDDRVIVGK